MYALFVELILTSDIIRRESIVKLHILVLPFVEVGCVCRGGGGAPGKILPFY